MSDTQVTAPQPKKKKWTLMFFFASDNTLSPSTLPQLKAIKAAGSQIDTNVLVYFDPNEKGAPTRVFQINKDGEQAPASDIESGEPVISVLSSDYISPDKIKTQGPESKDFAESLEPLKNDALKADTALKQFLGFCHEAYPAEHYMLFLVGHGLVVGRDAFLPDDNPDSAITLTTLGTILNGFKTKIGPDKLELIGMHSCSMSAVEVAYQLKGTASYMLACQGLSFVGSWPYRYLLTKIYHEIEQGNVNVSDLVKSLHSICIKFSVDFMHAGYSSDMCLCSLDSTRVEKLTTPISQLAKALTEGVKDPRCQPLILLAHWRSQSYWQETYTDLYDFCHCLKELCEQPKKDGTDEANANFTKREYDFKRFAIINACDGVINTLKPENGQSAGPIVCTDFVGPDTQYSHGLSIYFPWSRPREDANDQVIENYQTYAFTQSFGDPLTWFEFLKIYFDKTQRQDRATEEQKLKEPNYTAQSYTDLLKVARESFQGDVTTASHDVQPTSSLEGKVTPPDSSGGACTCASTKNYSQIFSMSPGVGAVFGNKSKKETATGAGSSDGGTGTIADGSLRPPSGGGPDARTGGGADSSPPA